MKKIHDRRKNGSMKLRADALAKLACAPKSHESMQTSEELLHELQVHQIELEMQNEELRSANAALEESRNRYIELYEFAPVGYITLTLDGRISEVSLNGAMLLGDERNQLMKRHFSSFIAADEGDIWHHHFQNIIQDDGKQIFELALQRKDGSRFSARLSCMRMETEKNATGIRIAISDLTDITELKNAIAEAKIAATVFESLQGMVVTDADKKILRVNRAFTDISGYTQQESVGKTMKILGSGLQDQAFYDEMWMHISRTGFWQGEIWNQRKNGEAFPAFVTVTAVNGNDAHTTHYVGTMIDITKRKEAENEIRSLAFYDTLTNLPNRRLLLDRLKRALAASSRNQRDGALLFIDLDNFKVLNDTAGHDIGDLLLVKVADCLVTCVREGDTVARLGGDEFVVILEDLNGDAEQCAREVEQIGEKILMHLNEIHMIDRYEHHTTASIGVTMFSGHQRSVEELLKRADLSMYQAKAAGRNTLRFFDARMQEAVTARMKTETELRAAILMEEFTLHFQPQVNEHGRMHGVEALVRWQSPLHGLVLPEKFITEVEYAGLILHLGRWVLESACAQLVTWAANPDTACLHVAVNVSARQFHQPNFVEDVIAILDRSGANPFKLKLELTESVLLDDIDDVIGKMNLLKGRGVLFSLDDFGVGYASLSYLKRLPFDQLKIDRSFIKNLLTDTKDAAITQMVIRLAHSMNIDVVAEGVETEGQCNFLVGNGCHAFQGYFFSPPLSIGDLDKKLRRSNSMFGKHCDILPKRSKSVSERRYREVAVEIERRA